METRMELVIGNKAWSTWSLRAWIALKRTGQPFTETPIRLRRPETAPRRTQPDRRPASSPCSRTAT